MKVIITTLIALGLCTYVSAESKTEVVVKDGIVKTTTNQGDSLIRSGQKVILEEGKEPLVSLNNKIVDKLLQMNRQIEAEREQEKEKILHTSAQVYSIDHENEWEMGAIVTQKNMGDIPTNELRIGPSTVLNKVKGYSLEGKPIQYKMEKIDEGHAYYYVYLDEEVNPGDDFKFLVITTLSEDMPEFKLIKNEMLTKHDGLWKIRNNNDTPHCLNYFQYILPETGIFVKSDPPAQTIEEQDGRVSVTIRKYVGSDGHGGFHVHFLWPQKDGASLSGIPWTNAGPEAVSIYDMFISENIQSPELWGELAIKLVGGRFYDQAYGAFERCYNGHASTQWIYIALTWQGHLHDLSEQHDKAVEKYQQALKIKPPQDMRHDQWGIVLSKPWIEERIETPFTEDMFVIIPEWKKEFQERFEALPWKNAGDDALQLYNDIVFNDIIKMDTLEVQDWVHLGLKLVGTGEGYYSQAHHCFGQSQLCGAKDMYLFCSLVWSGHLHDLGGDHHTAIGKYNQALKMDDDTIGNMRHDQWGIVLNKDWIRQRIESPFTEDMLLYPELNYRQHPQDSIAEPGLRLGDLYLDMTKDQVLELLGKPDKIFYNDQHYTLDNLPDEYCMAYPDYGVLVENNKVFELTTGSRFYQLHNGIRVGNTMQQVIETLGTNYEYQIRQGKTDVLRYDDLGLKFEIDKTESTVDRIEIFHSK